MRVFVAGATGALGRRLVPQLLERGHEVLGTTRTLFKTLILLAAASVLEFQVQHQSSILFLVERIIYHRFRDDVFVDSCVRSRPRDTIFS